MNCRKIRNIDLFKLKWHILRCGGIDKIKIRRIYSQLAKQLISQGQLEFINGGWCMNDEATPHYEDIIDQMTLGHQFILQHFNKTPTIGWQIDPFGHSSTQATLFYQMGFDAWFFARIDSADKNKRMKLKTMEMICLDGNGINGRNKIDYPLFSHVLYRHYEAPDDYNFDQFSNDEQIIDNPDSFFYNLVTKSDKLVQYFRNQTTHYKGNIITHTFGSDFQWSNATKWYVNLDKLKNYINNHSEYKMKLKYSTPSEYIKEINAQGLLYPTKLDDFFPYSDNNISYWAGYFTSRIAFKGYVMKLGRQAQTYRKLIAYSLRKKLTQLHIIESAQQQLDEALGVAQHHDAITGTEKQMVNDDYVRILAEAEQNILHIINGLMRNLSNLNESTYFQLCNLNQSSSLCNNSYNTLIMNQTLIILLLDGKINQQNQYDIIRIKVPNSVNISIEDNNNQTIDGDIDCTQNYKDCELHFQHKIPLNNIVTYYKIYPNSLNPSATQIPMQIITYNENMKIDFMNNSIPFKIDYQYYQSSLDPQQSSGSYIFRPQNDSDIHYPYGEIKFALLGYGKIMTAFHISRSYTYTTIHKYLTHQFNNTFNIHTFIDSIPIHDGIAKEIVLLINTNIDNNNTFYTDSNGLELQKRILNYRKSWDLEITEKIAGNYYPVSSILLIKDNQDNAATLMPDRPQGGTSYKKGQLELMIHRRLLIDDRRGVDEALNETNKFGQGLQQSVYHTLSFFNKKQNPNHHRILQLFLEQNPIVFYTSTNQIPQLADNLNWLSVLPELYFSNTPLMKLYIQKWFTGEYLVRIQNFQEDNVIHFNMTKCRRTTITGNQDWNLVQQNRLNWKLQNRNIKIKTMNDTNILLPLQIQTFIIPQY